MPAVRPGPASAGVCRIVRAGREQFDTPLLRRGLLTRRVRYPHPARQRPRRTWTSRPHPSDSHPSSKMQFADGHANATRQRTPILAPVNGPPHHRHHLQRRRHPLRRLGRARRLLPDRLRPRRPARRRPRAPARRRRRRTPPTRTTCSSTLDGVILSGGGSDVAPHRYGQAPHPATADEEPHRDGFEIALARAAKRARRPGARHLPRHAAAQRRLRRHAAPAPARRARPRRPPRAARRLRPPRGADRARLAGRGRHRQRDRERALAPPPGPRHDRRRAERHRPSRRATTAPRRSRIRRARFLLGVLWHPEEDERSRVVGALVDAARERQRSREA